MTETRDFIDHWDTDTTGDLQHDFAEAVDSARWGDDENGTLANKFRVILITEDILSRKDAGDLARELLNADDPRIANPHGPAGAIRTHSDTNGSPAWILFGRAPVTAFPPCRDDLAAQMIGFRPRWEEWLPVATAAQYPLAELREIEAAKAVARLAKFYPDPPQG
jgi:hypothetical protein